MLIPLNRVFSYRFHFHKLQYHYEKSCWIFRPLVHDESTTIILEKNRYTAKKSRKCESSRVHCGWIFGSTTLKTWVHKSNFTSTFQIWYLNSRMNAIFRDRREKLRYAVIFHEKCPEVECFNFEFRPLLVIGSWK